MINVTVNCTYKVPSRRYESMNQQSGELNYPWRQALTPPPEIYKIKRGLWRRQIVANIQS